MYMDNLKLKRLLAEGFEPLYMDFSKQDYTSYVCLKENTFTRVVIIHEPKSIAKLIPFMQNAQCTDLLAQFCVASNYCMAFSFAQGLPLDKALSTSLKNEQRATIVQTLLKELIKKQVDNQFLRTILTEQSIILNSYTKIDFIYTPPNPNVSQKQAFVSLAAITRKIWGKQAGQEAAIWLKKLRKSEFSSIHQAYINLPKDPFMKSEEIATATQEPPLNPSFLEEYWEFKSFYLKKRPFLIAAMIIMALTAIIMGVILPYINTGGQKYMGFLVCGGATLQCSFGQAPSVLMTLPANKVMCTMPAANIQDNKPLVNILPFGMCQSMSNPTVAAATAAAMGALTPMPCIPSTTAPWSPGCNKVTIANQPALNDSSQLNCMWGGVIQIKNAGQMQIQIP